MVGGAVYIEGDSIQIQADVTDARQGSSLGSLTPVGGSRAAAGEAIAELQQQVMGFLALNFDEALSEIGDLGRRPPSFDAYQAYIRGFEHQRLIEYADALPFFRRAYELDSTWAQPLIRMRAALVNVGTVAQQDSVVNLLEGMWDYLTPYEQALTNSYRAFIDGETDEGIAAERRAAVLAPRSPAVYNLALRMKNRNRPREAVELLRTLDPEHGWVRAFSGYWSVLAQSLHLLGEHKQELEVARRAFEQHPERGAAILQRQTEALAVLGRIEELNAILDQIESDHDVRRVDSALVVPAEFLIAGGRLEAGRRVAERAIDWFESRPSQEPASRAHKESYGRALFLVEREEDARAVFDRLVDEYPNAMSARAFRAFVAADGGDTSQASRDADWFERHAPPSMGYRITPSYWHAVISAALGEREQAVGLLRESYELGRIHYPYDRVRVEFVSLHDYPPFQELMRPKG